MFRKKILGLLIFLLSFNIFGETLKVLTPDGLPALSLAKMMTTVHEIDGNKIEYKIEKLSDALVVEMLKREGDIAIVPSNFAAQLYNKKLGYKILGTVGWGSFYVISRENIDSLEELKGREIYTFGKGLTPDIIFESIIKSKGIEKKDIKINYLSSGNEVAALYLGKKADIVVVPEPILSKILSKSLGTNVISNLNEEWKSLVNSDLGYPQSTLVIKEEVYNSNPKLVDEFVSQLKTSVASLYKNRDESIKYIQNSSISVDTSILDSILSRANILYTPILDCQEEYNRYFKVLNEVNSKVIGGKIPNEEIYAK